MDLLKFITCGSVDDGKSTLIGRLLYDNHSIPGDILAAIEMQSKTKEIDLALLTDGLKDEREQGITIDIAFKYFSTKKRKFIIADTPGHVQYTRNMVTAASNAQAAIILIDARKGILEQTKRHANILSIMGIKTIVIAINKIDFVHYEQSVFEKIVSEFKTLLAKWNFTNVTYIPISALHGDNVVHKSEVMTWYKGETLLEWLENITIEKENANLPMRFHVQYVIRPQTEDLHDFRGYAGNLWSGALRVGDEITVYPNEIHTKIKSIQKHGVSISEATSIEPIVVQLESQVDVSRGATFIHSATQHEINKEFDATICWMDEHDLQLNRGYLLQQLSKVTKARIKEIHHATDVNTLEPILKEKISLNDIAKVTIEISEQIFLESHTENKHLGSFILIDELSGNTLAAGLIENVLNPRDKELYNI